jgi:hypothetical protein
VLTVQQVERRQWLRVRRIHRLARAVRSQVALVAADPADWRVRKLDEAAVLLAEALGAAIDTDDDDDDGG